MKSRAALLFIGLPFMLTACASQTPVVPDQPAVTVASTRTYTIHQEIELVNSGEAAPEKQNVWVALIRSIPPYQQVRAQTIRPSGYQKVTDEYGNQYAEFDLSDHQPGETVTITLDYEVTVNELIYDLRLCSGDQPDVYTHAELHIESANPQIVSLAKQLSRGGKTACKQVRSFYDYVGDTLFYHYNQQNWGAQAALGAMGADCTEYASLMIALSRAEDVPARYYEGILALDASTAGLAETQHAWLDVHLPGIGWVAMDPTMGRFATNRERFFAHYTPDHIIVTVGRNPSTLRGSSYLTHLYWPGNSTTIRITKLDWTILPVER